MPIQQRRVLTWPSDKELSYLLSPTTAWRKSALLFHTIVFTILTMLPTDEVVISEMNQTSIIILLTIGFLMSLSTVTDSNGQDFDQAWQEVTELENNGLPKSARDRVQEIYTTSIDQGRADHTIKALLFLAKYTTQLEEDEVNAILKNLEEHTQKLETPAANLLQAVIGELYWQYYQSHRYEIFNRTPVTGADLPADIGQWDARQLLSESIRRFDLALSDDDALQQVSIDQFEVLLLPEDFDRNLRPTLFDLISHWAIDLWMNSESGLPIPQDQFVIDNRDFLAPASEFIGLSIEASDTLSLQYRALSQFKKLLAFRVVDDNIGARTDADLKRLQFVYQHGTFADKDSLYQTALNELAVRVADHPAVAAVHLARATLLNQLSHNYVAGTHDDTYKWHRTRAVEICEDVNKNWSQSLAGASCRSLISSLRSSDLTIETGSVLLPGEPFLAKINFRNVNEVDATIVPIDRDVLQQLQQARTDARRALLDTLVKLNTAKSYTRKLPDDGDLHSHSTEVSLPGQGAGTYLLVVSAPGVTSQVEPGYTSFQVSEIGYVSRQTQDGSTEVLVSNRRTGKALRNVTVILWNRSFNNSQRRQILRRVEEFTPDRNGRVTFQANANTQNTISIRWKGTELFSDHNFYSRNRQRENDVRFETRFFTDRSIYRPGQTIFFKGILLKHEKDEYSIAQNRESTVRLMDVNGQEIGSVTATSNEYGTIQGSFRIPQSVLPGSMSISDSQGSTSISVEEYKRPRFEVAIDEIEGVHVLGDSVTVTGSATSLFGTAIGDAEVRYRITRSAFYHPWYRYSRYIFPPSAAAEIASGSIRTDAEGNFEISFLATPDPKSLDKDRTFLFDIDVTVVDVTGETITANRSVRLNESGLIVAISGPETIDASNPQLQAIIATNPDGNNVAATGTIQIIKLRAPERILRDRLWSSADTLSLTRSFMRENHPIDAYRDENDPESWPELETIASWDFSAPDDRSIPANLIEELKPGVYRLRMRAVTDNQREASFESVLTVYDSSSDDLPRTLPFFFETAVSSAAVGDTVPFVIGTSADSRVFFEVEVDGDIVESRWLNLDDEQETISVSVKESFQGGFAARAIIVHANRVYSSTKTISVPHVNRNLDISFATFRSTLEPGSVEEWQIKITGEDGMPVAAEMMATMYDASLDQLQPHSWMLDVLRRHYPRHDWMTTADWSTVSTGVRFAGSGYYSREEKYPRFNLFGLNFGNRRVFMRGQRIDAMAVQSGVVNVEADEAVAAPMADAAQEKMASEDEVTIRTNLSELAFFFPQMHTDASGNIVLSFTMPEALTRWRMMSLAHSKDLKIGQMDTTVVTQKELMVVPNPPRFLRRGDRVVFAAKVSNLTDSPVTGHVRLELFDLHSGDSLDDMFGLTPGEQPFSVTSRGSSPVNWNIQVPGGIDGVGYRVVATSENFSDGEESALPVLDSRILLTESMPLWTSERGTKQFSFDRLKSPPSESMETYRVTLEYTSNPVWYAVQALPYLAEYPHEGAEHIFSRLYGNAVSNLLVQSNPGLEAVLAEWSEKYPEALKSNLQKNESLKSVALNESPWVADAISEAERKRGLVELFDEDRIRQGLADAVLRLDQLQLPEGAWPWFAGMRPNRYITQHIVKGFGWLRSIGALDIPGSEGKFSSMTRSAVDYLDDEIRKDYDELIDRSADLDDRHLSSIHIHYLYTRTLFDDYPPSNATTAAYQYYMSQLVKYWTDLGIYEKALAASTLYRSGEEGTAEQILASLREFSLYDEEMGMYWKFESGYRWNEAPIEAQAQLIATFSDLGAPASEIASMQRWLLKQKQTQNWETTRATTDAVYAIIRNDLKMLTRAGDVVVVVGDTTLVAGANTPGSEAATGYIKQVWERNEASGNLGEVSVQSENDNPTWGAVYWQYYEEQDKVTPAATPLEIEKEIYLQANSVDGPQLTAVSKDSVIEPGSLLKVRLTIRVDREMEYVHLKDLRAAGTEPVTVLSGYHWSSGLGYYEAVADASTSFFFDRLPKGTWVLDYELRVNLAGDFGVGPATIQNMYAPEFSAHSAGRRLEVSVN